MSRFGQFGNATLDMNLDVVYVSYRNDLAWLCYSIQLLQKHLSGTYRIVVRLEPDCKEIVDHWGFNNVTYIYAKPWPDGYHFAMFEKLCADNYTDTELIMLLDSDHLLLEPVPLENFFWENKPIIRYREWDEDPSDQSLIVGKKIWGPPTERTLGMELDRDYMVGPPFIFWRDTFSLVRARIARTTGQSVHDALYSDKPFHYTNFLNHPMKFCDYESLGLYAAKCQSERYVLEHHPRSKSWPFRVFWSHGDWSPQLQSQLDEILRR